MSGIHKPFIKLTDECGAETTYYSAVYEGFPEEFDKKANKKFKETEELKTQCLQKLKDYMIEGNFKPVEDEYLLAILRLHKYNLEISKEKLKNFLVKREEVVDMVAKVETRTIENMMDDMFFGAFPYRDENGSVIVFNRANGLDPENYEPCDVGAVLVAFYLFLMKFPISSVGGFTYFGDSSGILFYVYYILKEFKNFMFVMLTFPIRAARMEVFNESVLCRLFIKILSPFIDGRLLDMVTWHGNTFDKLDDFYDRNMLPEEFGGNMGKLSNLPYRQKFLDFIAELKKENY